MQTDLEEIPDGAAPTGAPSTAAPDPAPDPEVTHATGAMLVSSSADYEGANVTHVVAPFVRIANVGNIGTHTLIPNQHVGTLHEYIDGIERHTVIDWKAFVAFVREHFPKG